MQKTDAQAKEDQKYLDNFIKTVAEKKGELNPTEKVLGEKYLEIQLEVNNLVNQAKKLQESIERETMQLQQTQAAIQMHMGKVAGILEALLAVRPKTGQNNAEPKEGSDTHASN